MIPVYFSAILEALSVFNLLVSVSKTFISKAGVPVLEVQILSIFFNR